jgi:FKBP12-rapamycin complex-associated protein
MGGAELGDRELLAYCEAEARDLSPEAFARLMAGVYVRIGGAVARGSPAHRRLGAVLAIDELIDMRVE